MIGSWNVDVTVGGMPEKVATAFGKLNEMVGCDYSPIAYLGSQIVNGTNYAVLAEQTVLTGKDTENIVLVIFNEKPGDIDLTLVAIDRVLEGGAEYGGATINVETGEFDKTAQIVFDKALAGFVGSVVTPFALLGTQITRGTDFIFAAEVAPVVADNDKSIKTVALVTVNELELGASFKNIL